MWVYLIMILIVDDRQENIISLKHFLEINNFKVDTAESGEEALKKVLKNDYALIILDVQMPDMDGFEVTETLSGYSKTKDIPILFLSAVNIEKKFITRGYASGGVDYVTKPFDPDILLLKVKTFYKLSEQRRELNRIHENLKKEIAERIQAENRLSEKVSELHSILESIPQIAFTADAEGNIDYVNRKWFQYSSSIDRFPQVHPDDKPIDEIWQEALASGKTWQEEVFIFRLEPEEYRYHTLTIKPVKKDNTIIKFVGTFTDIHEQRIINELLEEKINERTNKLLAANRELEYKNAELQQFVSVASHDLKEPLRKVQVFSSIIRDRILQVNDDVLKDYINRIINSSERMTGLINDLLSFSRLSRASLFYPTDLNKLIADILEDIELSCTEKNAKIEIDLLPEISVIPGQMRQVFQNLLSNALKFTREGVPPHIQIKGELIEECCPDAKPNTEGNWLKISVKDNGIGFDETYLNKIFIIFQQLNANGKYEGTGIGLAIAKKIIDNHKGLITAKSTPGVGSEFIIILPLKIDHTVR